MTYSFKDLSVMVATMYALERRGVITTDKAEASQCCGIDRDEDGFCVYRSYHPIYVEINLGNHTNDD